MKSELERAFATTLRWESIAVPEREYRFHPTRKWRFDFAWPDVRVAVEIEGGTWVAGRHVRGSGVEADCEKYNEAALLGWTVLRVTNHMVTDGRAIAYVRRALKREEVSA